MKSRHRAREIALQILYHYDLSLQAGKTVPAGTALIQDLQGHFQHFQVDEGLREYAAQLAAGTLSMLSDLDGVIEKHVSNWKIPRMAVIDRSLLRMATYEMTRMQPEVPATVVIDEAVELAKQFGTAETPAFINGVLDAIRLKKTITA